MDSVTREEAQRISDSLGIGAVVLPFQAPSKPLALMAYPEGIPEALSASQMCIDFAAMSLASLAGGTWDELTPPQKDDLRAWAIFAATCYHADGLRLVAYSVTRTQSEVLMDASPVVRASYVDRTMAAIRGAAARCFGVSDPKNHRALCDLIESDGAAQAERVKRGGF